MAAVALAQLMNCLSLPPAGGSETVSDRRPDACGACASCKRIARGVHADVLLIEPGDTGAIKIDQVRDAIERSAYRPFEGRRRVVILDDADAMNPDAQNALLKTLEEPPAASTFVLVTSRPDMLLPTVRSRCQRLRFGRLSPADVAAVLMRDHAYAASRCARCGVDVRRQHRARARRRLRRSSSRRARPLPDLLETAALSNDPRRRLDGAKALSAAARGRQRS